MLTPGYSTTATERVLPRMALDFTTAVTDARVVTTRAANTATRFNGSGAIEIVNANLPRYDYNPVTLVCIGQLVEEARTNLLLNSLIDGTNLSTQSVTLSAVAYTLSFYGTGSIVISGGHSATVTGAGAFPNRKTYTFTPTAGSSTFTVSGTVAYAQLEAGAFVTSFIPTAGTAVLRNADAVMMTGTNFSSWFNATEGTFLTKFSFVSIPASQFRYVMSANDGTATNFISIAGNTTSNVPAGRVIASSATQASMGGGAISANQQTTGVLAYKKDSFAYGQGGTTLGTDTLGNVPTVNRLEIGALAGSYACCHIQRVSYWSQRLTNNETQSFSK